MSRKPGLAFLKLFGLIPFLVCTILLHGQPVANFSASNTSGCAPLLVKFTDQSTGSPTSWSWDFGNGQLSTLQNPVISYAQPGTYTVRLIVKDSLGIDDEIKTDYITVFPAPRASFSANLTTSCIPATIQFSDKSTSPPGTTISSWSWNFGDGTSSTAQNPSHTYNNTGFYTVSLQITSSTGCKSTLTVGRYIRIIDGIDAEFAFSQPSTCKPPFLINFVNQSSGPGTLSYTWNFGNGSTSTLQNPNTIYNTPGTYHVQFAVQSNLGCNGFIAKDIVVAGKTTDFTFPPSICVGQSVTFQNNSSPPPVASTWDFGDGTTTSQINPVKTFLAGGTYQVRLINNYGNCIDSVTKTVTVISSPTVDFTANDTVGCDVPFAVQFTDKSPNASSWLWDFGDGTTSTQQNPNHTYTNSGSYDVTLTITLPGGCSNSITKTQYIKVQPMVVTITNAPAGGCAPFTFSPVLSVQSIDSIVSYSWDLGEPGAIYNVQSPTHTYNSVGNYNIQLTVTTQHGCTKTISIPNGVMVGTKPTVDFSFTPNNTCASTPIQFTDMSTTSPGASIQWIWDFGDGTNSSVKNPSHIFRDIGTIQVRLTVLNNGCPNTIVKPITVLPPVADFAYKVDCNNRLNVTFSDSSKVDPGYGPISYQWDFGDGGTSTAQSPTHLYTSFGTYNVTLTVTNGACSFPTTQTIILSNELADFAISKNPVCNNETFSLRAINSTAANIKKYTWTVGGTTLPDTTRNVTYRLSTSGTYDVTLTIEDINGCTNTKTVPNYITVRSPVAKFSIGTHGACINSPITFTDQSTPAGGVPITQWTWGFGDGTLQTFTSPPFSHAYSQTGTYSVSLFIRDSAGCSSVAALGNALLITHPTAAFRADTFYCPKAPLQFVDTSIGLGLTYNWSFGDGGNSTLQNPTHSYPAGANTYTVKLKIKDLVGCADSVTKTNYISIRTPKAAFDVTDSAGICLPVVTSFTFKGSDYKTFNWDFGDGTSTTAQNPAHFYNSFGTFIAKLYTVGPGGCIDSAQATITAYNPSADTHITFSPGTACNSLTSNFNLITPPGFNYKFYFGDGSIDSTQQPSLTHLYASPGNYTAFLVYADKFGCDPSVTAGVIHVYGALPLFDKSRKEFCDSGSVTFKNFTLTNDPITSTTWDFGDGTTSNALAPSHFFVGAGTYSVQLIVTTQNNCTSIYADTIRVYKTPAISISGKDTFCINSAEQFTGSITVPDSTIQWLWNFGNGNSSQIQTPTVVYSAAGDYNMVLTGSNKLGCSDTAVHSVVVVPLPTADPASNPITVISGGSAQLNMNYTGPVVSYNWSPAQNLNCITCPTPTATPRVTTDYHVQVEDRYGCKNSGDVTVKVICNGQNFFIPNTFSPNGDGINDVFYLRGSGLFRVNSLMIFNRWGELVFENRNFSVNDPLAGWNGSYRGKKATPDVYIYQVELICENGETIKYSGNIALIQ